MFDHSDDTLRRLRTAIDEQRQMRLEVSRCFARVPPGRRDGFEVSMQIRGSGAYNVYFNGWHEGFRDADEAIKCFLFGLSRRCRLKVFRRGSTEYKWTVQYQRDGEWVDDSTTGLLFFPFWRRRDVVFLQNALLD
jgi:hypothetical protein